MDSVVGSLGADRGRATRGGFVGLMTSEAQFAGSEFAEGLPTEDVNRIGALEIARRRHSHTVIALVGMNFEARIAAGPGVQVFSRSSRHELAVAARNAARLGCRGIISFGVAGGLAADLKPGDWVVASAILESGAARHTDAGWASRLREAIGPSSYAPIVGVDVPVADPASKRELHRSTGAAAADMESHLVARLAAAHGLAFAALRVIVDPADRAIPSAALMGMGPGAAADGRAVLRDLAAQPRQIKQLLRISLDAYIARAEMLRVRRLLGPHFGLTDLGLPQLARSGLEQDLAPADVVAPA